MRIKVVCYNLDQRMPYSTSAKEILQLLVLVNPDILILQEVMNYKEVVLIAQILKLHYSKDGWYRGGQAVLSKYPIIKTLKKPFPHLTWWSALVGIQVKIDNKKLWVFSVHLIDIDYLKNENLRMKEMEHIIKYLPPLKNMIIGGDFNSPSHLDSEYKNYQGPSQVFETMELNDTQASKSWTRGTWLPSSKCQRIDRLYHTSDIVPVRGAILDKENFPQLKRWPTGKDHRLIYHYYNI